MGETVLVIQGVGLPRWSARGCSQDLVPVKNGSYHRSVNGQLLFTGSLKHCKYQSIIKCKDRSPPAFDGIWQGLEVEVQCIQVLIQRVVDSAEITLGRRAVAESVRVLTADDQPVAVQHLEDTTVVLAQQQREAYVHYRPILTMRVLDFNSSSDEWEAESSWQLKLSES